MSYDLELAEPFLQQKHLADHIIVHKLRDRQLPLNSERHIYGFNNLIVQRLTVIVDDPIVGNSVTDWAPMSWAVPLHFDNCRFRPYSSNMADFRFPWRGQFRFHRNDFIFSGRGGSWLFAFCDGSDITFLLNDFQHSDIQMISVREPDGLLFPELSWKDHTAYLLRDNIYYKAMIRQAHQLPESVRLAIPDSPYLTRCVGLRRVAFVGNKNIRELYIRCDAENYAFRGRNRIETLQLPEPNDDIDNIVIYVGRREQIDPNFHRPTHHRNLFVSLKNAANRRGDTELANTLTRYVDRIEYFLTKEHRLTLQDGLAGWLEYWQDRCRHSWRRWSSNFYGSWMRPLVLGVAGYVALNALAWIWIDAFTVTDWVAFSLRRVDRIPFYTDGLKDLHPNTYEDLTATSKNWLRAIGMFQNVWVAMWGFAFSKAVRRGSAA